MPYGTNRKRDPMTTEHQIAYSSDSNGAPDRSASGVDHAPKEKQLMHREEYNAKSNVCERQ
jgi:hypothetical protein